MTDWMNQALCREVGTDVFFAEEKGASPKQGRSGSAPRAASPRNAWNTR